MQFPLCKALTNAPRMKPWPKEHMGTLEPHDLLSYAIVLFLRANVGKSVYRAHSLARDCNFARLQNRIWLFHPGRTITRLAFLRAKDKRIETDDLLRKVSLSRKQVDSASLRTWELRAPTSLARLWRDQGKARHARELLAPVYGWFTEGFDTRDLKEAKALLEELA